MKTFTAVALAISFGMATSAFAVETPRQNIIHSQQYEHLLHTNNAFRHARIRKECGPLLRMGEHEMFHDCVDSFYR